MPHKLKTLVILTPGFPENEADSTCIPPQQIFVKALKQVQPELNIVVLAFQYPFFSGDYEWYGIRVISFGNPSNSRIIRRFTGLKVWIALRKLHKEYDIIGMLSFWLGKCAYIGSMFAAKYNLMHYTWLLGQDAKKENKYFYKADVKSESLIALSDFVVREFNKNYNIKPAYIIPVGIDVTLFKESGYDRDIDILGVGSLIPLKQYKVFIEMIELLKQSTPNVKAVICGDGEEMRLLKDMVAKADLSNQITFAGRLPHLEVLSLMQRAKVFLHPSNYEGFGAVCVEALYAGAKVVSFVKPMDACIPNWFIAEDKNNMLQLLSKLLEEYDGVHQNILPYDIHDNARAMLKLFGQSELAIADMRPAMAPNER